MLTDPGAGVATYQGNVAGLESKGIDLLLSVRWKESSVRIENRIGVSYNVEKITDYYLPPLFINTPTGYLNNVPTVGKPLYRVYSYAWGGLDPANGDPMGILDGKIVPYLEALRSDAAGNPNTKPEDLRYHGRGTPSVSGFLLSAISYKNFSLSFNCTYSLGFYFRRNTIDYNRIRDSWSGHGDFARRWKKPGDELQTYVPSFKLDSRYTFYRNAEILVERGDNIYLQDLNLSYQITKTKLRKLPVQQVSLLLNTKNLGFIWRANDKGLDPRQAAMDIPVPFEFAIGLNIIF